MDADRRDRIVGWLLIVALVICVLALLALVAWPLLDGNTHEFYIRLFLFLFTLLVFAVLRMYNAVVNNTRFSIKLREAVLTVEKAFPKLENGLRNLQNAVQANKTAVDTLNKSVQSQSTKVQELTEEIKHYKQFKKEAQNDERKG